MPMSTGPRAFLERPGHVRFQLQRLLAEGNHSKAQLAKQFGASVEGIREFEKRHVATIQAMRDDLNNRFAGLWIADKEQRVASYMADVELVEAETARVLDARNEPKAGAPEPDEDGELAAEVTVATDLGRLSRIKHRALRSVAEELGQLPTRMLVKAEEGGAVHVYGSGVDTDKV
jgi:hypothetical protein